MAAPLQNSPIKASETASRKSSSPPGENSGEGSSTEVATGAGAGAGGVATAASDSVAPLPSTSKNDTKEKVLEETCTLKDPPIPSLSSTSSSSMSPSAGASVASIEASSSSSAAAVVVAATATATSSSSSSSSSSSEALVRERTKETKDNEEHDQEEEEQQEQQQEEEDGSIRPVFLSEDLSYEGTESSDPFVLAKRQSLVDGDFEAALETIGTAMAELTSLLPKRSGKSDDVSENDEDAHLHPAMAPFFYLYGTTLLYSIEESADTSQLTMNTANATPAPTTTTTTTTKVASSEQQAPAADSASASASVAVAVAEQLEDMDADDSQIAWENLETSRLIVTKMLEHYDNASSSATTNDKNNNNNNKIDKIKKINDASTKTRTDPPRFPDEEKLRLDLAQIHLRLGDLERLDGRYSEALGDYLACLEIRQPLLGVYNSKVTDVHHNLALVYMALASEGDRQHSQQNQDNQRGGTADLPTSSMPKGTAAFAKAAASASASASASGEDRALMSPEVREQYRHKALTHYLATAKSLAGRIAFVCGADPEGVTAEPTPTPTQSAMCTAAKSGSTPTVAGLKTTGLASPSSLPSSHEYEVSNISRWVSVLRERVAVLQVVAAAEHDDEDDHEDGMAMQVADWKEILDHIQETIDEAETAKKALSEVSEMATNAKRAAAAAATGGDDNPVGYVNPANGSITTIGFGNNKSLFNAASASATKDEEASEKKPVVMVVRKKKKRDAATALATTENENNDDQKMAAVVDEKDKDHNTSTSTSGRSAKLQKNTTTTTD